jgi:DNA-binding GntR family transcriptional regulator
MSSSEASRRQRTVARRNISRQAADIIRDMILVGELKPGQVVTHEEMSGRLGVSTMPIREALLRLSHEGFIDARQSRSFRVVRTSRADIEDLYWMHGVLSGELAARACSDHHERIADELDVVNQTWASLPAGSSAERYEELNWEFHRILNLAAAAPKLLILLRHTIRFIPDHFYTLLPEWHELSRIGHAEIAAAIRAGDPDHARQVAISHVRDAGDLLIGYFQESGFWQEPDQLAVDDLTNRSPDGSDSRLGQ